MERCVIIGNAEIGNYEKVRAALRADDSFLYCDGGLKHRKALGKEPDLIVGDFDSAANPNLDVETIVLPREKDDTDTVYAVKEALRRGFEEFLFLGVTGERMDHTLGNLSLLLMLHAARKKAVILDDYSEMEIVSDEPAFVSDTYSYFSLLNISGTARGITITGAKYPLSDAEITCEYQYGISNEVLPGETAQITVREGCLLLVKVF